MIKHTMNIWKKCAVLLCSALLMLFTVLSASAEAARITGAIGITEQILKLEDGTETGVTHTQMRLPSDTVYNSSSREKEINLVEFDLADTHLSVDVINCGEHIVDVGRVAAEAADYTAQKEGKTVLAAMNGDLWMTTVNSNSGITKALLRVSRGIMMVDGEIWASQEIGMENASATGAANGTTAAPKAAFGVTSQNQPLVGIPIISVYAKNETRNIELRADGLNRLPADDSIIVYNHRCYTTNYALNDSYEIEIEASDTAFSVDGSVVGQVKAIYPSGSEVRPAIGANTVVITVRGDRIAEVAEVFRVGDTVSFQCDIKDTLGNTELWRDAVSAMGGHILLLSGDQRYTTLSGSTEYPVSLIGIKDDGTVMFCSLTAAEDGVRLGANYASISDFVEEIGYNSVFFLDGGGSTTMVTLEEGSYVVRSHSSDGSPRSVISAVAVVWNDTPVCEQQGDLGYIKTVADVSGIPGYYIPADLMPEIVSFPNACELSYDSASDAFEMTVTSETNDPFATLDYARLGSVSADVYKYIVIKAKTNFGSVSPLKLYYVTGTATGVSEAMTASVMLHGNGSWAYYMVDMSQASQWNGTLRSIRLDIFDGVTSAEGDRVSIGSIMLCQSLEEAVRAVSGSYLPAGAVVSYREYLGYPANPPSDTAESDTTPQSPPQTTTDAPTATAPLQEQPNEESKQPTEGSEADAPVSNGNGCSSSAALCSMATIAAVACLVALDLKKKAR